MIVGCFDIYKYSTFVWYAWHCVKESSEKVVFPTGDPNLNPTTSEILRFRTGLSRSVVGFITAQCAPYRAPDLSDTYQP